jgi:hypothetical protein
MEASPYTRLVELCERLAAATTQGDADWAADEETSFVCRRRAGSVGIRSRDADGEPPYELIVYGPNGAKVENLLSEWNREEEPAFWNPALAELYRAARRNALGVDRILDDLFAELPPARPVKAPASA